MKISKRQQKQIDNIGKKYKLDMVVLHGSQATGKIVSLEPDIDIAVFRCGGISFDEQIKLTSEFMDVFGDDIDLKTLHKKDALFAYHVLRDSVLLFGNKSLLNELKAYAYHRYIDAKPLFRLRDFLLKKKLDRLKSAYNII